MSKVKLYVRITLPDGRRKYCHPVYSKNKRLKAGYALVNGKPQAHPEAIFALRYTDRSKRVWDHVGSDPDKALIAKLRQEYIFTGRELGKPVAYDTQPDDNALQSRKPLVVSIEDYVSDMHARRKRKTANAYEKALALFRKICDKKHVEDVTREDLLKYSGALNIQRNGPRTIANRLGYLITFLKSQGRENPLKKIDIPKFTKRAPNAYNKEFLQKLFAACNLEERLVFRFFLLTGCREQEVSNAYWPDVDVSRRTLTIQEKVDLRWTLKDYEERSIPLPSDLVKELKDRRKARPDDRLIFPTVAGKPDGHFLRILKRIALHTGLNCGHCINKKKLSCEKHPVCEHIELHRFRRTFATMHHANGATVHTLMRWLGHSDIETTMAYLAGSDDENPQTRDRIDQTFAF